jgi:hypothetical protein
MATPRSSEEVEILGRACRQVLRQQGRSPSQEESITRRLGEEQLGDLLLKGRKLRCAV